MPNKDGTYIVSLSEVIRKPRTPNGNRFVSRNARLVVPWEIATQVRDNVYRCELLEDGSILYRRVA